jgi:hypothetical protein
MSEDVRAALAEMDGRLATLERTVGAYLADHTGWLLALQAIVAVGMVRHMSTAADPEKFLADSRAWSKSIIGSTTPAATLPAETVAKIREMAAEKLDRFFTGISIQKSP